MERWLVRRVTLVVLAFAAALPSGATAQADGDLDATWGNPLAPGREINYFDLGPDGTEYATGVVVDPAGRAVTVGAVQTADPSYPYATGLARFTAGGAPDSGFGDDPLLPGTLLLDLPGGMEFPGRSLLVEPDGRIVVAGTRYFASLPAAVGFFSRLEADGSSALSTVSFNLPATPFSLPPRVRGFARDGAGRFLAFGDQLLDQEPMVARLTSAFALDTSFGVGGWVLIDAFEPPDTGSASVYQLVFDRQGRMVAAVSGTVAGGDDLAAIVRRLPSGAPDPSFGTNGVARVVPDFVSCPLPGACHWTLRDVVAAPDGRIYAAGWVEPDVIGTPIHTGWLVRLGADGAVEAQAGVLPLAHSSLELFALALDPAGAIVAVGAASSPPATDSSMFATRYGAATLAIDPNFATGGRQEFDFVGLPGYTQPRAGALALATDAGRPLLAGLAVYGASGSNSDFAVARLVNAGIFLDGFETGGVDRWSASTP